MLEAVLKRSPIRQRLMASTIAGSAALLALTAVPAMAQDEAGSDSVEDIVVTGSRIARQDYRSTSPIVTTDAADFQATGAVTIDTLLNQLPQFTPSVSSTSNNPSNGGQANIDLRSLGTARTLTLINGRRLVPSNSNGAADINILPTALIKNVEVISGGASAAYGSDALAGVANFILNESFEGVQFDAQYGETDRSDGATESYSVTIGGNFADDKGNMVLSLGRSTREVMYNAAREFSMVSGASGTTPLGSTVFDANNRPADAFVNGYFATPGLGATGAFGFNNDGSLFSHVGTINFDSPGGITYDGFNNPPADYVFNTGALNYLQLPLDRWNVYGSGHYTINDNAEVYSSVLFTEYNASQELAATPGAGSASGFRVPANNPFISSDLRAFLNARPNPNGSFALSKRFTDIGGRHSEEDYNVYQITSGLRGKVPNSSWTYDVYSQYGHVNRITTQTGNVSRSAVQSLLDANDGGVSLCAGGFNPFGESNLSAACQAFISRSARNATTTEQRVIEATLQGKAFDLPAGEVRLALGAQYRQDNYDFRADASLAQRNPLLPHLDDAGVADGGNVGGVEIAGFNAAQSLAGMTNSKELFGEALIPLLTGLPFMEQLDLTLGYRYADYNTVGGTQAYRADLDWEIGGGLRARGGYNRAVRAPSVGELFSPLNVGFPSIGSPSATGTDGDPCDRRSSYRVAGNPDAAKIQALCIAQGIRAVDYATYVMSNNQVPGVAGGNPDLDEETSDSYSAGLVYQPSFSNPMFSRISASLDYWNIQIDDVIGAVTVDRQLRGCFNVTGENPNFDPNNKYCQFFRRDPLSGNIDNTIENSANLGALKTSGIDLQVDWSFDIADAGGPDWGSLAINTVISYLDTRQDNVFEGGVFTERKGTISSSVNNSFPEWKALTSVNWTNGAFGAGLRWRRVGEITILNTTQTLPAIDYFDLNGSWAVNDTVSLRAGVNNVTDEDPNVYSPGVQANTDPSLYDILGRRYYVGLTAKF